MDGGVIVNVRMWTALLMAFVFVTPWGCGKSRNPLEPANDLSTRVARTPGALTSAGQSIVLWNRLGSVEEVTHSPIGPSGEIIGGLQYLPGQFGNGFCPLPRTGNHNFPDNYVRVDGLGLGQQGCIEFWYQPTWRDWRVGHIVELLYYGKLGNPGVGIQIQYNDWQDRLSIGFGDDYLNYVGRSMVPSSVPQWSTMHPFHIALSWDGTALTVADRLKVFFDGAEVGVTGQAGDPRFTSWPADQSLYIATRVQPGDWDRHNWEGGEGVIDNIKVWNYPKTDFSDRFTEAPVRSVALDVMPGACPNPFNVRSRGVLPVAILGRSDFSVTDIDVESLRLNGVAPLRSSVEDVAAPAGIQVDCGCTAAGPDGQADLTLKFDRTMIVPSLGGPSDGDMVPLVLTGKLRNGWLIEGKDCVMIINKRVVTTDPGIQTDPLDRLPD
jgi:hypothetical protein